MKTIQQDLIRKINKSHKKLLVIDRLSETDFTYWRNKAKAYHQQVISYPETNVIFSSLQEKNKQIIKLQFLFSKIILDLHFHDIIHQQITDIFKILSDLAEKTINCQQQKQNQGFSSFSRLVPVQIRLVMDLLKQIDSIYNTTTGDVKQTLLNSIDIEELHEVLNIDFSETENHLNNVHKLISEINADLQNASEYFESINLNTIVE